MPNNKIMTLVNRLSLILLLLSAGSVALLAQSGEGQDGQPNMEEILEKEISRLESNLKLEDWQVFYVDSILHHNYEGLMGEMRTLQRSGAENPDLFYNVQDKWMIATETAYQKIFTPEQWNEYLKQGGAKVIKDREKRQKKTMEATQGKTATNDKKRKK